MKEDTRIIILFLTPIVIVLLFLVVYPIYYVAELSLHSYMIGIEKSFVGLDNYVRVASSSPFINALGLTLAITTADVSLELIFGLSVALVLSSKIRGKQIFRSLFLLPMFTMPVVSAMMWQMFMYDPTFGLLNHFLKTLHLKPLLWSYATSTAALSVLLIIVWQWTPFAILILAAGIESLPKEPFEAATIDGASRWQTFRHITIPLLRPVIIVVLLIRIIDSLRVFDLIIGSTQGGPGDATTTLNILTFYNAFTYYNFGTASTMAILLLFVVTIPSIVIITLVRKRGV